MTVTHLIVGTLAALFTASAAGAAPAWGPQTGAAGIRHAPQVVVVAWQFPGPAPQGRGRGQGPPPRPEPAPGPPQGIEATEPFSQTLRLAPEGTLDLANLAGDIVVTGGAGEEVRIEAIKRAWHDSERGARALLQEMRVRVIERGGTIEVRTEGPRRRDWPGAVEYTVVLPPEAHVTIRTVSGAVRVTNVTGDLRAESISGSIGVTAVRRVVLKSFSGDIQMSDVEGQDLTAGTVSGNLTAHGLRVHTIDMESVSGELRLTDIESTRARIRSINGPIDYRGRLARSGHYELMTHSGAIRIAPAGSIGFDLDASTLSGSVRSELTLGGQADRTEPDGRPGLTRVRGTFGDVSAALSLRSFSGDILIAQP